MTDWHWIDAEQMAGLPGLPGSSRRCRSWMSDNGLDDPEKEWSEDNPGGIWRKRSGRGGGRQVHIRALPPEAQTAWALQHQSAPTPSIPSASDLWSWFERQPDKAKVKARARLATLDAVMTLVHGGISKDAAIPMVAAARGVAKSSIWGWFGRVAGIDRRDWVPHLADRYAGRLTTAECSPGAWEHFKANYLRPECRTAEACYDDLRDAAAAAGWTYPSLRSLMRRLEREVPVPVRVLCREGTEALKRLYPAQQRRRDVFHALEAVNGDGHKFDVFVRWPDGEIVRPMMVGLQDVYSGKLLSYRVDKTENREAIRLALGDLVEAYGIPDHIYFDNTRAFANKMLTAGANHRYRFKTRDEDPVGIITLLGSEIHFVSPYSGQSKPIERAWRDLADRVSTHPALAGAYTGKNPTAKPENYGSKAIPLDEFLGVLASEIAKHNARDGRRTAVCAGRSFDAVFAESYAASPIRKATPEQRRLWLLAAEGIRASSENGSLTLLGNRYWDEFLLAHRSGKLCVRFDPQDLMAGVHVYDLAGCYLGFADVIEAAGFNDVAAARDHAARRRAFIKAARALQDAERRLTAAEVAASLPEAAAAPPPDSKIVTPMFGNAALKAVAIPETYQADVLSAFTATISRLRPVDSL